VNLHLLSLAAMVAADLRLSAAEELLGDELESTSAFRGHDFNGSWERRLPQRQCFQAMTPWTRMRRATACPDSNVRQT
jgi:hypothetical protein